MRVSGRVKAKPCASMKARVSGLLSARSMKTGLVTSGERSPEQGARSYGVLGNEWPELRRDAAFAAEQESDEPVSAQRNQGGGRHAPAQSRQQAVALAAKRGRVVGADRGPHGIRDRLHIDIIARRIRGRVSLRPAARASRAKPQVSTNPRLAIDLAACRRGVQDRDKSGTAQIVDCVAQELRGEPAPPPGGRHQHHADPAEAAIGQGCGGGDDVARYPSEPPVRGPNRGTCASRARSDSNRLRRPAPVRRRVRRDAVVPARAAFRASCQNAPSRES